MTEPVQPMDPNIDLTDESTTDRPETSIDVEATTSAEPIEDAPLDFDALELEAEEPAPADSAAESVPGVSQPGISQEIIESLNAQIQSLKAQVDDRNGNYMRIAADFENFRKRTQKEKEELEDKIKCNTILELLPVIDNFERARTQLKPEGEEALTLHKSYQGVYKQFVDCLKRVGVSPMRAEGQDFDPLLHEAVLREPTADHPEGTVMDELQRGYMLGDRVLRHAMVKVAAPPEDGGDSPASDAA
jgi:molecular chaperone GrpE